MNSALARGSAVAWLPALAIAYVAMAWSLNFGFIPFPPVEPVARWIGVLASAGALMVTAFLARHRLKPFRGVPVLAFVLALALSVPFSDHPSRSFIEVVRVSSIFLLFLAVTQMTPAQRDRVIRLLWIGFSVLVLGSVVADALAWPQAYLGGPSGPVTGFIRLQGLTWHPNTLGYCAVMAITGLFHWREVQRAALWHWPLLIGLSLASLYCLYRSDSRTADIAAAMVTALAIALPRLERQSASARVRRRLKMLLGLIILISFLSPVAFGFLGGGPRAPAADHPGVFRTSSIDEREILWKQMPASFESRPITGTGFWASRATVRAFEPRTGSHYQKNMPYYHALLVTSLATTGLLGFCAALWLLLSGAWAAMDRLGEQDAMTRGALTPRTVRACVLMLAGSYPFAALDGALQGDYESMVVWFVALATLYSPSLPDSPSVSSKGEGVSGFPIGSARSHLWSRALTADVAIPSTPYRPAALRS